MQVDALPVRVARLVKFGGLFDALRRGLRDFGEREQGFDRHDPLAQRRLVGRLVDHQPGLPDVVAQVVLGEHAQGVEHELRVVLHLDEVVAGLQIADVDLEGHLVDWAVEQHQPLGIHRAELVGHVDVFAELDALLDR